MSIKRSKYISVAPMMGWTDRHCRHFHRLISPNIYLYSEMITTGALLHGDRERFLRLDKSQQPVVLQLGGSDPHDLALCAKMAEDYGYNEVNLNCGCPSDRVQNGSFGACMMKEPDHVATCIQEMIKAVDIPVTIKCRIGVDNLDSFEFLDNFLNITSNAGCKTFIIHARKAWLNGLSPKENREVPPINYERAAAVKEKYPHLRIIVNGNIKSVKEVETHLNVFDGVMIGRAAYQNPYLLAEIEREIFKNNAVKTRDEIARSMIPYAQKQNHDHGAPVKSITRHMTGLYHRKPGARSWRQNLSTLPHAKGANCDVINQALCAKE